MKKSQSLALPLALALLAASVPARSYAATLWSMPLGSCLQTAGPTAAVGSDFYGSYVAFPGSSGTSMTFECDMSLSQTYNFSSCDVGTLYLKSTGTDTSVELVNGYLVPVIDDSSSATLWQSTDYNTSTAMASVYSGPNTGSPRVDSVSITSGSIVPPGFDTYFVRVTVMRASSSYAPRAYSVWLDYNAGC